MQTRVCLEYFEWESRTPLAQLAGEPTLFPFVGGDVNAGSTLQ